MIKIYCKIDDDGNEYLPEYPEIFTREPLTKRQNRLFLLYALISEAEERQRHNPPRILGNPILYSIKIVKMVAALSNWECKVKDGWIIIKSEKSILMKIQKPKMSEERQNILREDFKILKKNIKILKTLENYELNKVRTP